MNTKVSVKFVQISYNFGTSLCEVRQICVPFAFPFANVCCMDAPYVSSGTPHTLPHLQVPFHAWSPKVRHHGCKWFTPHHRVQLTGEDSERGEGSGARRAPSETRSEHSEGSTRSAHSAGERSEASWGARGGRGAGRQVVFPMPFCEYLGTGHVDATPWPGSPCLAAEGRGRA